MTVVVADTSPLNYLLIIDEIAILPRLYGQVLIPPEVLDELRDSAAPPEVAKWVERCPPWLQVCHPRLIPEDDSLRQLDPGERAAILLAQHEGDVLLLIDDAAGRTEAARRGIPTTGTLGILRAAAVRGLLDLPAALNKLTATNFRVSKSLVAELLAEDARREGQSD